MKKRIAVEIEIEVEKDRPDCCGKDCFHLADGSFAVDYYCDIFNESLITLEDFSVERCAECKAAREVGA